MGKNQRTGHISKAISPTDFILGTKVQPNKAHSMTQVLMTLIEGRIYFFGVWVTKEFCDSMFLSISVKNVFFFFRKTNIFYAFYAFGPMRSFYEKLSSGQNFNLEKFQFQIISKPFDQSTSYFV